MTPPQAVAAHTEKEVTLPRAREEPGRFSRLPSADHLLCTQLRGGGYSCKEPAMLGRRRARGRAQILHIRFKSPAGAGRRGIDHLFNSPPPAARGCAFHA